MAVADDELDAAKTAAVQAAQELDPKRLGFRCANLQAEHLSLALGVHADRHYHRDAHDAPCLACLDVGGIDPQVRPVALDLAAEERAHAFVELAA